MINLTKTNIFQSLDFGSGAYSGIFHGEGLTFFFSRGGAQHPLGPEKPLKSIDFTGYGGA